MPQQNSLKRPATLLGGALALCIGLLHGGLVQAATTGSVYSYSFANANGTITNTAAAYPKAALTLTGNYTSSAYGTHFSGDLNSLSGAGYKPAAGNTITVPSNSAVGVAVRFKYQAPATGSCFGDSSNLTQIGRFAAKTAQIKLQYSNCGSDTANVYMECRLAGNATPSSVLPVRSSQPLVAGAEYTAKCYKTPDALNGKTTTTLRVAKLDPTKGNVVTTDTFFTAPTGAINTTSWISVGNKYPLPAQAANTDQFNGDIAKVSYCQSAATRTVQTCLDTEQPEAPAVQAAQYISNPGFETDLRGWSGVYGSTALVRNARSAVGSHSGNASIQVTALAGASKASLGFNDNPRSVLSTSNVKSYQGSVWVKPGFIGQEINLRLREWNGRIIVTDSRVLRVAASTNWQQITAPLKPAASGNQLSFAVYGSRMNAGDSFLADDLSLTSN